MATSTYSVEKQATAPSTVYKTNYGVMNYEVITKPASRYRSSHVDYHMYNFSISTARPRPTKHDHLVRSKDHPFLLERHDDRYFTPSIILSCDKK